MGRRELGGEAVGEREGLGLGLGEGLEQGFEEGLEVKGFFLGEGLHGEEIIMVWLREGGFYREIRRENWVNGGSSFGGGGDWKKEEREA